MYSRKKTTISTDRCWDEGRKTATENSVEKVSGGAPEPAVRESRESEAACKIAALRDNGSHNAALTAAPEKWMLEAGEYTMKQFAGLYGMNYKGMATDRTEAIKFGKNI